MSPKEKALMKNKRNEYMGDERKEEKGTMKEGKEKPDTRKGKDIMKPIKICEDCGKKMSKCMCE